MNYIKFITCLFFFFGVNLSFGQGNINLLASINEDGSTQFHVEESLLADFLSDQLGSAVSDVTIVRTNNFGYVLVGNHNGTAKIGVTMAVYNENGLVINGPETGPAKRGGPGVKITCDGMCCSSCTLKTEDWEFICDCTRPVDDCGTAYCAQRTETTIGFFIDIFSS
jgi:hypothetical protein